MAARCHAGIRISALHPMATRHNDSSVLRNSSRGVLVVDDADPRLAERTRSAAESVEVIPLADLIASARNTPPAAGPAGEPTYLFYTGGSTAEPKGVILRDRSLVANAWATATWPPPHGTRFLIATPMSHAAGLLVAPELMRSAEFHIHDRFEPARMFKAIEHDGVNAPFMVPTMLYALLDHPQAASTDLHCLQWLLYGAAPTVPARIIEAPARLGPVLTQHYGQAEASGRRSALTSTSGCP